MVMLGKLVEMLLMIAVLVFGALFSGVVAEECRDADNQCQWMDKLCGLKVSVAHHHTSLP